MGSLLTNTLCCAGNCLCHCCNNICSDAMKINPKLFSRIGYIVLSLISVLFSLLILFYGSVILKPFNGWISCPIPDATVTDGDNLLVCLGVSSVYRMSFTLLCLHVLIVLCSLCSNKCAQVINNDCWSLKVLLVIGIYFAFFFVSNSFFSVYASISRYVSLFFILYQVLVTISFAHIINLNIVDSMDEVEGRGGNGCKYQFCLLFLTAVFGGLAVFWIVAAFIWHHDHWYNFIIIGLTILLGVAFIIISISKLVNRKRLLTSVYMLSFTTYLCWSALESQPKDIPVPTPTSNSTITDIILSDTFTDSSNINFLDIAVGLVYLFLSLCFLGFYIKKNPENRNSNPDSEEEKVLNSNPLIEEENKKSDIEIIEKGITLEVEDEAVTSAYIYFQIFMVFMSIYYCMLLTNWNVIDANSKTFSINTSWVSFWIKIITMFLANLLYIFVLLAPRLFPDREFMF